MMLKEWINKNRDIFYPSELNFLLRNILNKDFHFQEQTILDNDTLNRLENIKELHKEGWPLAYLLKKEEFFGLEFYVNEDTLIPRPSTERLVELALDIINKNLKEKSLILDLGCGCSNIAISILKNSNKALYVVASDISYKALKVSKINILNHNTNIKLVCSDMFECFKKEIFDIIVSNPPYVETDFLKYNRFEPRIALDGKEDGLYFIKKIVDEGFYYLKEDGFLLIEIGDNQREKIERFDSLSMYSKIYWIKDYSSIDRVLILKK